MKVRSRCVSRTSVIVALIVNDALTDRARNFLQTHRPALSVSDYGGAELASVVARRVRAGELTEAKAEARSAFDNFDQWARAFARLVEISPLDVARATGFVRRLDLNFRAPGAVHLATAERLGLTLVSFDARMLSSAVALGIALAPA